MNTTLKIDILNPKAVKLLKNLAELDLISIKEEGIIDGKISNKSTLKAIEDVEKGKTFKVKSSKQLFEELGMSYSTGLAFNMETK